LPQGYKGGGRAEVGQPVETAKWLRRCIRPPRHQAPADRGRRGKTRFAPDAGRIKRREHWLQPIAGAEQALEDPSNPLDQW